MIFKLFCCFFVVVKCMCVFDEFSNSSWPLQISVKSRSIYVPKARFKRRILHALNLIAELSACIMRLLNQFNSADLY